MSEFVDSIETLSDVHNAVSIFGSARVKPDDPYYKKTEVLAQLLVQNGFSVITGGGPGIMEAATKGASEAGGKSVGMNIRLPFEQKPNPVLEGNPRLITYKYFFNRKVAFLKEADAVALFPGGFGTLDEAMETLTLVQTKSAESVIKMRTGTLAQGQVFGRTKMK